MNRREIDGLSWRMSEVYADCVDKILVNLARHFQFIKEGEPIGNAWNYQVRKLAEMDAVTQETAQIILNTLGGADETLQGLLIESIQNGLKDAEPTLRRAAEKGLLKGTGSQIAPNQMQAFRAYYKQSADKLNLVNTVMLDSTQNAYRATVSDISSKIDTTQGILNTSTGEVITGVNSFNKVQRDAVRRMVDNGLTGFIDHGGHHWSPEAYVAMDMRTTMSNTARAAVFEQADEFGVELYQVSHHNGARPLCYPWQGKVISRNGWTGEVRDDEGNPVQVHSEDEIESFQYGGGLFGVNCGHYPIPFIPGFSRIRPPEQDEKANAKEYAESQQQRALERNVRNEKRELEVMRAQGADKADIDAQKTRVKEANADLDQFCKDTGRARRPERTATPINATFPDTQTVAPVPPASNPVPTNIFGERIKYSEKLLDPKYDSTRSQIETLTSEFKTKLKEVNLGAKGAAGTVDVSGSIMKLSSPRKPDVVIHEFAHSISSTNQTKFGLYDERPFWDEIRKIRTQYRKSVRDDPANWISTYADSENKLSEFMAEGFALAYMREKGIPVPFQYGNDTVFSKMVLDTVRKYFGR